jgi:hypothetical protein
MVRPSERHRFSRCGGWNSGFAFGYRDRLHVNRHGAEPEFALRSRARLIDTLRFISMALTLSVHALEYFSTSRRCGRVAEGGGLLNR